MSGIKQEVQWSPVHHNEFITWGADIFLYRTVPADKVLGPHLDISQSISAQLLATNSSHQYLKCVDIYPKFEKDTLLAVGQANGKVSLATFGSSIFDSKGLAGLEFAPKHSRQCNAVQWNCSEVGLLASGLDRYRGDHAVLVWDVDLTDSHAPVAEIGLSDSAHSLAWLPSSRSIAAGLNNKAIKIIDLKDSSKIVSTCQTKAVYGLSVCPDNQYQLASYFEHQLAIWDLRSFEKPLTSVQKTKPISRIAWCPTRKNLLGCLLKESSSIHMVEVQARCDDREEASVMERSVRPGMAHHLSSFSWHPSNHNRLIAISVYGGLMDYSVSERMTLSWGNASTIAWTSDSKTLNMITNKDDFYEEIGDISVVIKKRVLSGYGLLENLVDNADLVESDELKELWRWLDYSQELVSSGLIDSPNTSHPGIRTILEDLGNNSLNLNSEAQFLPWSSVSPSATAKVYRSELRDKALNLCGWKFSLDQSLLQQVVDDLVKEGKVTKAAAYCVFCLKLKNAIQILANDPKHCTVAMAVAGFTDEKNSIWKESCSTSWSQLTDPYLKIIFSYLTSDMETYDSVFVERGVDVCDRVGFALTFLSDLYLPDYLDQLMDSLAIQGDLAGLLLTGMTSEAIPLLQQYINITSDIQTPSLIAMRTFPKDLLEHEFVSYWITCYRDLLDTWMLWEDRAKFDIRLRARSAGRPEQQVFVSCNFCGKSATAVSSPALRSKTQFQRYSGSSNQTKVSCCVNCRKPQPRCAICLAHMGTGSVHVEGSVPMSHHLPPPNPFDSWYTWCQTCRHGGHVVHIASWFKENTECPVTGCLCKCKSLDPSW